MTTYSLNGHTLIGVIVPEDAHSFEIVDNNVVGGYCLMYLCGKLDYDCQYYSLPEGQYIVIGLASEITEEEAAGIGNGHWDEDDECFYYMDYEHQWNPDYYPDHWKLSALASLHSFIRMHKKEPGKIVLLTRKKN